jgi:hypothetical protein
LIPVNNLTPHISKIYFNNIFGIVTDLLALAITCSLSTIQEPGYLGSITLGYGLDDRRFESRQVLGIFLSTTASRPVLGPTQHPINVYKWLFSWG